MEASLERSDKHAWMIAAFTRAKKLPKYSSLSRQKKGGPRPGFEKEMKAYFTAQAERERKGK